MAGPTGPTGPAGPGAITFTLTLATASWSSNQQTVSNGQLIPSGYSYIVVPDPDSYVAYTTAGIWANDVTQSGSIVFNCTRVPSAALTVNVMRVEV